MHVHTSMVYSKIVEKNHLKVLKLQHTGGSDDDDDDDDDDVSLS